MHVFTKGEHLMSYSITVPYSFVIGSLTEPGTRLSEIPCLPISSSGVTHAPSHLTFFLEDRGFELRSSHLDIKSSYCLSHLSSLV